jgi:hypothetical protein
MPTLLPRRTQLRAGAGALACACLRLPAIAGGWMLGEARGKRQEARGKRQEA